MINQKRDLINEETGWPYWWPFWYIQYEPTRLNEAWLRYKKSVAVWPPKYCYTSDPDGVVSLFNRFYNRFSPGPQGMWKKIYVGRRDSLFFPMEWRLLFRVPADLNNLPNEFIEGKDQKYLPDKIDTSTDWYRRPPVRGYPLDKLNSESV